MSAWWQRLIGNLDFWAIFGAIGQLVFMSRMLVQWFASERRRESVVPESFWWISIAGSALVLVYGIKHAQFPVILGQSVGSIVYIRNLMLIRSRRAGPGAPP